MRKKLPIGIQTFSNLIREGYCYVDKTALIHKLVEEGKYYFLSRPRRFGKSLLISTLKSLFRGERELFTGLAIEDEWDWSRVHPVIHISFGGGLMDSVAALETKLQETIQSHCQAYGVELVSSSSAGRFSELIFLLRQTFNQPVVVLIDEYDKPILDNLVADRNETAIAVRDQLKGFYAVLKDSDEHLRFALLTGVSKFSKVSLFSGLNNLRDITLDSRYATVCGYTEDELTHTFADWLDGVDREALRRWYNGYNFDGERVYNPFDVLLYLDSRVFRNYWFESGSPSFLLRLLQKKQQFVPDLERVFAGEELLSRFDIGTIAVETLMFQAGYLTIRKKRALGHRYGFELTFPNREVKMSLSDAMLHTLVAHPEVEERNLQDTYRALEAGEVDALRDIFHAFFASIPHDWYRKNQMANYEGYYCSIVYCYFAALGLDVAAEESTNKGRIDLTVKLGNRIFIIEFKVVEMTDDGSALQQIEEKGYGDKYRGQGEVWLIGIAFSSSDRNIVGFESRQLP
ncbi:MAG: ATP-binding protein [Mariprofundales bacterium]